MKKLKFLILVSIMLICSTSFADTYNRVPIFHIDYAEFAKPIPTTMPQSNYYNDWSFNRNSYTQNNSSNYNYQNNNTYDSGSTYFIYSSSPNPSYCIPGSSYSICH